MAEQTKLIIIRGSSGAGKSAVAKMLMEQVTRPTVLVDLDYYRFSFVNPPRHDHNLEYAMSASDILVGLRRGFDVIFDGNFALRENNPFLAELFRAHPGEKYLFYLEASLEETLKRHATRPDPRISADSMRELYRYASPTGYKEEVVIPESSSLAGTVRTIREVAGI